MFQTFSGSSRKPRQVNLSGRNKNPFGSPGSGSGTHSALESAQQERQQRQREREKQNATKTLQRVWRGHRCRREVEDNLRKEWDTIEQNAKDHSHGPDVATPIPYASEGEALAQLQRLLIFIKVRDEEDINRLQRFSKRQEYSIQRNVFSSSDGPWPISYLRLQKVVIAALDYQVGRIEKALLLLSCLKFLVMQIPRQTARNSKPFYRTIAKLTTTLLSTSSSTDQQKLLIETAVSPLQGLTADTLLVYETYACIFLTLPALTQISRPFAASKSLIEDIADRINSKILAKSLADLVQSNGYSRYEELSEAPARARLLACFIYLHRHTYGFQNPEAYSSDIDFITVVSQLLSSLPTDVISDSREIVNDEQPEEKSRSQNDEFVQEQLLSLVNKQSIGALLSNTNSTSPSTVLTHTNGRNDNDEARQFANYALTLLRLFPMQGDEIRMWLYFGSSSVSNSIEKGVQSSAIRYFWQATSNTMVFKIITQDSRAVIKLIKPRRSNNAGTYGWQPPTRQSSTEDLDDEWRIILIFMELYIFVLKLMDDEEFFSARSSNTFSSSSRGRNNALPLDGIQHLVTFLKNLGFTLYFNAAEISDLEPRDSGKSISSYFGFTSNDRTAPDTIKTETLGPSSTTVKIAGLSLDYVKGLVTGLLRMIYERDSRRKFLPADHWLMTTRFDMEGFIPAVVQEEESRHKVQEEDREDGSEEEEDEEISVALIGTRRIQQAKEIARLQRQQRKASRKRYLQAVAPRLEILQNMPFMIPFSTRVQIFREFVHLDQLKRRHGVVDADQWRMHLMHEMNARDVLVKHHARIRRDHEFDDAYEQFYDLNEGLKEPIQITFIDQFGTVEAGIDGGGVTKEFLTRLTSQAFTPTDGFNLFVENEQHVLYPSPAALDERKEMLKQAGFKEGSTEYRASVIDLLQRYEFCGRVVGKCLYEGILVDINFAGFFLLKWALTGGRGSAPKESGYRANLNDLRDLDEGLYQGLLQLKNYDGDVEDLGLTFTVDDTITTDYSTGATKVITRNLHPNGANEPVRNDNRLIYIAQIARHRLQSQPLAQTNAFLRGLATIIQPSWLSMFNQSELQTLLGGSSSSIDIPDLRRNTQYGGVYVIGDDNQEHPSVRLFWHVMESLSDTERRAVLKFVTSTPRAPLLGFGSLNPKFSIRDAGDDQERLPSTSTCVNLLKLPRYQDERTLREKLLYAVNANAGWGTGPTFSTSEHPSFSTSEHPSFSTLPPLILTTEILLQFTKSDLEALKTKLEADGLTLDPSWLNVTARSCALLEKLAHHPAMASNLHQMYMTPAADKNKGHLMNLDFANPDPEKFNDCIGRTVMAQQLILDTKPGMLDMMTESTYSEQKSRHLAFGGEIVRLVEELMGTRYPYHGESSPTRIQTRRA
ncbi:hypothetical protein M501DRAFT_1054704 [Patellaria atrata CBS 101060]|uniref:HECT-type E3 ubiquitin transferase n=1 Tax=Patellaria atrata CBS 101060 TaxID=1346257 RepID=A0A9P4SG91_9PEZI|nr:hypothetical protein M501DRAFT_1054704 [Patellaria atrata CBS 101060]